MLTNNSDMSPQEAERVANRLIGMCKMNIDAGLENVELKLERKYNNEKSIRVIGDLHGKPISYSSNSIVVQVNARKMRSKLEIYLKDLKKKVNKDARKGLVDL
jgi:hypothetical protein